MEEKMKLEEAWRLAIEREQEARDFYAEMAEMIEDSALKNLFAFLIKQEENHKQLGSLPAHLPPHFCLSP